MTDGAKLSKRQLECLQGVADHLDSQQIAERLGISPHTVDGHVSAAMKALDALSRRDAVKKWRQLQAGQSFTGEFSPVAPERFDSPAMSSPNTVREVTVFFDHAERDVPPKEPPHELKPNPLRVIALVLSIALILALLVLAIEPLTESAKHLANRIQPYH